MRRRRSSRGRKAQNLWSNQIQDSGRRPAEVGRGARLRRAELGQQRGEVVVLDRRSRKGGNGRGSSSAARSGEGG